ncbi:Rossmann-like and DUF2520 domain-containing protein [Actinomycetota bacterium]
MDEQLVGRGAAEHPARLRVGVVGSGRVGSVLGAALRRAGHDVVAVSAVSEQSRARAEALLPGVPVREVAEVVGAAELVLLTVPDDALGPLVSGLAETGALQAGQIVVHTSGRHGTAALSPVLARHCLPVAMHPAMTFAGTEADLDRLDDCCFGVTCDDALRALAEALVLEMGGEPVWVDEIDRPRYHAALAHGSNHLVTLIAQALQILRSTGIEQPARVLGPLVTAALDNALRTGDAALTGPVARGDAGTVAEHLRQLRSETSDVLPTYVALATATAERARASGRLRPDQAQPLLDLLAHDQEQQ